MKALFVLLLLVLSISLMACGTNVVAPDDSNQPTLGTLGSGTKQDPPWPPGQGSPDDGGTVEPDGGGVKQSPPWPGP